MENISCSLKSFKQKTENRKQINSNQSSNKLLFKQKTEELRQSNLDYEKVGWVIDCIPFPVNQNFRGAIAMHLTRVGLDQFQMAVDRACEARSPERYLMKCLINIKDQLAGGAPQAGPTTNFN